MSFIIIESVGNVCGTIWQKSTHVYFRLAVRPERCEACTMNEWYSYTEVTQRGTPYQTLAVSWGLHKVSLGFGCSRTTTVVATTTPEPPWWCSADDSWTSSSVSVSRRKTLGPSVRGTSLPTPVASSLPSPARRLHQCRTLATYVQSSMNYYLVKWETQKLHVFT